jgi:hypothetical protein
MAPYFAVNLSPYPSDWDWIPGAPTVSVTAGYMYFGAVDPKIHEYVKANSIDVPVMLSTNDVYEWVFDFGSFSFGNSTVETNKIEFENYSFQLEVGYNGFGLPKSSYHKFETVLRNASSSIKCTKNPGSANYCYTENSTCLDLYASVKDL